MAKDMASLVELKYCTKISGTATVFGKAAYHKKCTDSQNLCEASRRQFATVRPTSNTIDITISRQSSATFDGRLLMFPIGITPRTS
jgi:hypothetical protein